MAVASARTGTPTSSRPGRPWTCTRGGFTTAANGIREAGVFSDPEQWRFDWEQPYTRDEWLDLMPTQGTLTRLPPDKLAEVQAGTGAAIDALGGSFTMPYITVAVTATRTGAGKPAPR